MAAALFKNNTWLIHIEHTKSKWDLLREAGDAGSNEPDLVGFNPCDLMVVVIDFEVQIAHS